MWNFGVKVQKFPTQVPVILGPGGERSVLQGQGAHGVNTPRDGFRRITSIYLAFVWFFRSEMVW